MTKITKILSCLLILSMLLCSTCLAETTEAEATLQITNVSIREPITVELFLDPTPAPLVLEGTIIRINSKVRNAEAAKSLTYTWYVNRGGGFELVSAATNSYYEFAATKDSLTWSFKLVVTAEW